MNRAEFVREHVGLLVQLYCPYSGKVLRAEGPNNHLTFATTPEDNRSLFYVRKKDGWVDGFSLESYAYAGKFIGIGSEGVIMRPHMRGDETLIWIYAYENQYYLKTHGHDRYLSTGREGSDAVTMVLGGGAEANRLFSMRIMEIPKLMEFNAHVERMTTPTESTRVIAEKIVRNLHGKHPVQQELTASASYGSSTTVSFSHSITVTLGITFKVSFLVAGTEISLEAAYGHTWGSEHTEESMVSVSETTTFTVPAHTEMLLQATSTTARGDVPFTALVEYSNGYSFRMTGHIRNCTVLRSEFKEPQVLARR